MSPVHDHLLGLLYERYGRSMLTMAEVAAEAGYPSVDTLYRMQKEGRFPPAHDRRVSLADYVSWAAGEWGPDPSPPARASVDGPALTPAPLRAPAYGAEERRLAHVRSLMRANAA